MAAVPQFIVTFRNAEVGRYETADRAMAAARSVIDTELGSRVSAGDGEPDELPRIEWQPPRVPFPFDASAYWRQRVESQMREAKPAPTAPPTAAPTSQISLQQLGVAGEETRLPRAQERLQRERPPAPVYSGPPQQRPAEPPQPTSVYAAFPQQRPAEPQRRPAEPQQRPVGPPQQRPAEPPQPAPMYGGPQWAGPTPPLPPPMSGDAQWGAPPPPPSEQSQESEESGGGKRRWFGKKRDRSE